MPHSKGAGPSSLQPHNEPLLPFPSHEDVPDDVWLLVLALLPTEELLSARLVCRRWRDLAALPDPWRHRCIGWTQRHLAVGVLRVAPCVRTLKFDIFYSGPATQLAASTDCACEELCLSMYMSCMGPNQSIEVVDGIERALRRQAELGRLRRVALTFNSLQNTYSDPSPAAERLSRVVLSLRLTHLHVDGQLPAAEPLADWPPPPMPIRMKSLMLPLHASIELTLQLISQHSDSLEELHLWVATMVVPPGCADALALAVSKCISLRSARLPLMAAVPALALPDLRSLAVTKVCGGDLLELLPADATAWSQLHRLELGDRESAALILTSIASSGRAQLREVVLRYRVILSVEQLRGWMPGLPHLQVLVLHHLPPVELLQAITPTSAPSLRMLSLQPSIQDSCPRGACGLPHWRDLVSRNPLLHLRGLRHRKPSTTLGDCECSRLLGCAATPKRPLRNVYFGLYGHAEGAPCEWHYTGKRDGVLCDIWFQSQD